MAMLRSTPAFLSGPGVARRATETPSRMRRKLLATIRMRAKMRAVPHLRLQVGGPPRLHAARDAVLEDEADRVARAVHVRLRDEHAAREHAEHAENEGGVHRLEGGHGCGVFWSVHIAATGGVSEVLYSVAFARCGSGGGERARRWCCQFSSFAPPRELRAAASELRHAR